MTLIVLYKPKLTPLFIRRHCFTAKAAEFAGAAPHDIRYMPGLFAQLALALTATLVYRGLTLWLPLLPGFFIIQREFLRARGAAPVPEISDYDQP